MAKKLGIAERTLRIQKRTDEWGYRHHENERKFEAKVKAKKEAFQSKHKVGKTFIEEGVIEVKVTKYDSISLSEPQWLEEKRADKMLRFLEKAVAAPFIVYMGYQREDTPALISQAVREGVQVFQLDVPEEWGYSFIAVQSLPLQTEDGTLYFKALEELDLGEDTFDPNEYREQPLYPFTFLSAVKELRQEEIPSVIKAQLATLSAVAN